MNRPRIATVLSAREWEPRLVDAARRDPTVRVVRRVYEPEDLERAAPIDIVVVGAETSWITSSRIKSLRRNGTRVIGVYPSGDGPGRALLERGGADAAIPDSTPPEDLLQTATAVAAASLTCVRAGRLISVTGPRGAPGRTEIAVALAKELATTKTTALVDLDFEAPGVGLRLGLRPGPGLHDLVDDVDTEDRETMRELRHASLDVVRQQPAQIIAHPLAFQVDDRHVRDVEHARGLAHGVMLVDLRTVVDGHVPAREVDQLAAGGHMFVI